MYLPPLSGIILPMAHQTELITGTKIFTAVPAAEWNQLAQGGITDTPFQTHAYQSHWWHNLGRGELISIVVRDSDGRLIGLAVFLLENQVLQFNASKEESDYLDLIVQPAHAETVWAAVIGRLCADDMRDQFTWTTLDCWNIPADSPTRTILPRLAQEYGFACHTERAEVCPIIPLSDTFDTYLAGINKKQRGEIRRKLKKAAGAGVTIEIIDTEADLEPAINDFLHLLQCSTPDKDAWLDELPTRATLFHSVAQAAFEAGTLLLMFTNLNGQRISALFNFIYNGRIWVYNSGNDISQHNNLSLGWVLTAHAIQHGIEQGCHTFDFLRGDETYKYRFGGQDTEIFRLTLQK